MKKMAIALSKGGVGEAMTADAPASELAFSAPPVRAKSAAPQLFYKRAKTE